MSLITRATKVTLDDHGALTLRPTDYITQGGEGAIYRNGQYIIKLYLDAQKMQQDDMVKKVRLLATSLKHSSIVAPQGIVSDTGGKPIGYYMPFVSGEAYPRIFTNDWRTQNNFNLQSTICLTAKMHEVVAYAHDQKALMVDANELNWIADVSNASDPVPYVIDVDSWQIERFKASVIMPSIRDWHSVINEASDWFAWGVVTFLLYTGIHPYRGKLDGYKPGEMERRMKNNASVFLPEVKLNKAVRDFRTIPGPLLDWYKAVFTDGERSIPPSPLQVGQARTAVGRILRTVTTATGGLIYEKLFELLGDEVKSVWPCGIMRMNSGSLINLSTKREIGQVSGSRVAVTSHNSGWLVVEEIGGDWHWRNIDQKGLETKLSVPLEINSVVRSNERLFVANDTELVEMSLHQFSKPVLTIGKRWQILGKSTKWFQGVGVS
ncbi:hypothetical protein KC872_02615, partial [Candidatus Kaiserbacteria bacterium]|nr:hypothetical protein [Candidatus Kaiserbacteria bacterium]